MKISELIRRLEYAQKWVEENAVDMNGDIDVYIGERSSELVSWIDVNVDSKGKIDGESWSDYVCIVQAYHVFKK